ncbi:MAG: radical SAM protein, partial [Nanoarchaeota archaeon]|nr:radical SAM protein [Nanoarchaeota archaeon]
SQLFNRLLLRGFNDLKNSINGNKTIYIHKNSGIPLIGNVAFGLVDRGSNLIEVKPITSCNLACVYCSVDEAKRPVDFVVEADYLVEELRKIIEFKGIDDIEAHIGTQGEPLLYASLSELIKGIRALKHVKIISMDTNGTMLSKDKVDDLVEAGLTRFNLSINAIDDDLARKIAEKPYDINRVMEICRYIVKKADLIITPVMLTGLNEDEMPKIIRFAKEIGARIGIQNFLNYRLGRNPVKQLDWDRFYDKLKQWEKDFDVKLVFGQEDFKIVKSKELPKPFRKGEVVKAEVVMPGRLYNEKIAVTSGRTISVFDCHKNGAVKLRIIRTKHNIFVGEVV